MPGPSPSAPSRGGAAGEHERGDRGGGEQDSEAAHVANVAGRGRRANPESAKNRHMPVDPDSPRYARQRVLAGFGRDAQQRLAGAHVVVIGAGGLGSTVLPALAAAGVGTIAIVDDDTVDETNLHRQTLFTPSDVGRPKVDAAADAMAALAPDVTIVRHPIRFAPGVTFDLLLDADLLIDGSDNLATRYLANDAAAVRGIPMVWGSALRWSGQVGVAWDERGVDYRDLFPEEPGADERHLRGRRRAADGVRGDRRDDGDRGAQAPHRHRRAADRPRRRVRRAHRHHAARSSTAAIRTRRDPVRSRSAPPCASPTPRDRSRPSSSRSCWPDPRRPASTRPRPCCWMCASAPRRRSPPCPARC